MAKGKGLCPYCGAYDCEGECMYITCEGSRIVKERDYKEIDYYAVNARKE